MDKIKIELTEEQTYLINKIQSNKIDSEQLKAKGNTSLSGILDDETEVLEKILFLLENRRPESSVIHLNGVEQNSGRDRIHWAEGLIEQLDPKHDGRNSWLLNYGRGELGQHLREQRDIKFDEFTQSAELTVSWKTSQ